MPATTLLRPGALRLASLGLAALLAASCAATSQAGPQAAVPLELPPEQAPTYADLVALALAADTVAVVMVDQQIAYPPERAPGVAPGHVRLYIEALTQSLLKAPGSLGQTMLFVLDQPLDPAGRPPRLRQRSFLAFGDQARGQPGVLQLLSSRSLVPAGPRIESEVRRVLTQLADADAPPAITGLRDVISVPGNLAGESETQIFVASESGAPVSLTVIRRPGQPTQWGVSLGELVDASARPPERETVAWYRLACGLPRELPAEAFLQRDRASQDRAREDYALVLRELGPCERRFT